MRGRVIEKIPREEREHVVEIWGNGDIPDITGDKVDVTREEVIHLKTRKADVEEIIPHVELEKADAEVVIPHVELEKADAEEMMPHLEMGKEDAEVVIPHLEMWKADVEEEIPQLVVEEAQVEGISQTKVIDDPLTEKSMEVVEEPEELLPTNVSERIEMEPEKIPPRNIYKRRSKKYDETILLEYKTRGITSEDINYLKLAYEEMLGSDDPSDWVFMSHWVDHCPTRFLEREKKRSSDIFANNRECSRTSDITSMRKASRAMETSRGVIDSNTTAPKTGITLGGYAVAETLGQATMRTNALADHRRLTNEWGMADKIKLSQKSRNKMLKFKKSSIHSWGLFADEDIPAHDMVIEYVGSYIRMGVAEIREKEYLSRGEYSSYLFKVGDYDCIDATMMGNLARFINHSCNPNCSARMVDVDGRKKVYIYSKCDIARGEELTYDYKFTAEEGNKIKCFCGSHNCRQYLN